MRSLAHDLFKKLISPQGALLVAVIGLTIPPVSEARNLCESQFTRSQSRALVSAGGGSRALTPVSYSPAPQVDPNDILIATLSYDDPQFLAAYFKKHHDKGDFIRAILKPKKGLFASDYFLKRLSMVVTAEEKAQTTWNVETMTSITERLMSRLKADFATNRGVEELSNLDADLLSKKISETINGGVDEDFRLSTKQFQAMRSQYIALATEEQGEKFLKSLLLHTIDKIQDSYELMVLQQKRIDLIKRRHQNVQNWVDNHEIQNIWGQESTGIPHLGRWIGSLAATGSAAIWGPLVPTVFLSVETAAMIPTFFFFHALWPYTPWNGMVLRFINNRVSSTRLFYRNRITAPMMRFMTRVNARKKLSQSAIIALTNAEKNNLGSPNELPSLLPPPEDNAISYDQISDSDIDSIAVDLSEANKSNPFEISLLGQDIPNIVNSIKLEAGATYSNGMSTSPELFSFVQSFEDVQSVQSLNMDAMMKVAGVLQQRRDFVIDHIRQLSSVFSRLGLLKIKAAQLKHFLKQLENSEDANVAEAASLGLEFVNKYNEQIAKAEKSFLEMQANLNKQRDQVERFQESFNPANPEVSVSTAEILVELREAIMAAIR